MKNRKLLIVGTAFKDKNALKTQGQYLLDLLLEAGLDASIVSEHRNYFHRIKDTLSNIAKLKRNDVVILQVYSSKSIYLELASCLIGKAKGCILISTLHGGAIPSMYKNNFIKRAILKVIFKFSNSVTAPSSFIASEIRQSATPIKTVYNVIDSNDYVTKQEYDYQYAILWMRAYHKTYNPIKALEVVLLLKNEGINVKLYMAGPDLGLLKNVREFIREKGLSEQVEVFEKIDIAEKNKLAKMSSVYLNTTEVDNSPVSFLEMMALGIPIITTDVGGIPLWVENNENALLSNNNTADDLKEKIKQLLNDHMLYQKIVKNNKEHVKKFSKEEVQKSWLNTLDETIKHTT